ncbi:HEPN domain-containing protein [Streptomyces glaucus]|uniref:RiboL-PSP-HEPN domain-containing protein n=1 Tax=Streptomyces glaucus TaxID=284029 RepID=A0ABP5WZG9_9ACTN
MREALAAFRADCAALRAELDLGPVLLAALSAAHADDKRTLATLAARSKRQSYVNGIISLYGLLEESVDKVVIEVAEAYSGIFSRYSHVPERTRVAYKEFSLRSLLEAERVRLREPIDEAAAIHALTSSVNNMQPQWLPVVFTYATANYRFPYIAELLHRVDIDVRSNINESAIRGMLTDSGLDFRSTEGFLADLVARRNEVAHSYQALNLLDVDTLRAYLDVTEFFIEDLQRVASERVLRCLTEQQLQPMGKVAHVWRQAIGVDMTSGVIQTPCKVVLVRGSSLSVIDAQSLQSDGIPLEGRVQADAGTLPLGISFSGQLLGNFEGGDAFVLPEKWSYLSIF